MAKDSNHFFAGAVFGGLIGGLMALALSPKTGKEFRQAVVEQTSLWREKVLLNNDIPTIKDTEPSIASSGIPLKYESKSGSKKAIELEKSADAVVENVANSQNSNVNIEKILADTEKAFTDAEQKFHK